MVSEQYQPQLLNRVGYFDPRAIASHVERDIALARDWQPGTQRPKSDV